MSKSQDAYRQVALATCALGLAERQGTEVAQQAATAQVEAHARATAEAVALVQRDAAQRQTRAMFARQLGAQVQVALNQYPQRSLLLAVEALRTTLRVNEPAEPLAEEALRMALSSVGGRVLVGHEGAVWPIVFSPDGHWLVTNDYGPTAYLGLACTRPGCCASLSARSRERHLCQR